MNKKQLDAHIADIDDGIKQIQPLLEAHEPYAALGILCRLLVDTCYRKSKKTQVATWDKTTKQVFEQFVKEAKFLFTENDRYL